MAAKANGVEIAKAYLTIVPTMRGMKNALKGELGAIDGKTPGRKLGKEMSDAAGHSFSAKSITSKLAGATKGIAKTVGTAVASSLAVATAGIAAIGKQALESYANYEQLVGGVDTLFGDASKKVQEYAANAYMTAGMSANEYMETVTSFSASLLQSLGGDTAAAAEKANMAITDMSDNANKMGTDMTAIQNAYQGFAKQNYTMLDNLKLGYGGTKEEMERLLADAQKISGISYSIGSYADIVDAIHVIQEQMGIAGTTAMEASTTIEGSFKSMKAAYGNFLTGLMDKDADLGKLIENLITTATTFAGNVAPVIQTFAQKIVEALPQLFETLASQLPGFIGPLAEAIEKTARVLLIKLSDMMRNFDMSQYKDELVKKISDFLSRTITLAIGTLADFVKFGAEIAPSIIEGFAGAIPEVANELMSGLSGLLDALMDKLPSLADAGVTLIASIAEGIANIGSWLPEVLPKLIDAVFTLAQAIVEKLPSALFNAFDSALGGSFPDELGDKFRESFGGLGDALGNLFGSLKEAFAEIAEAVMPVVQEIAMTVAEYMPPIIDFISEVVNFIAENVVPFVTEIAKTVIPLIGEALNTLMKIAGPIFEWLGGVVVDVIFPAVAAGFEVISGAISTVVGWLTDLCNIAQDALDWLSKVWDGFANAPTYTSGPMVDSSGYPIYGYASGGYVDKPTLAVIGEGGYGEYMVPRNYIGKLAAEINNQGGGGGKTEVYVTVQADSGEDAYSLGRRIGAATAYELKLQGVSA